MWRRDRRILRSLCGNTKGSDLKKTKKNIMFHPYWKNSGCQIRIQDLPKPSLPLVFLEESVLLRLVFRIFQRRADSRRGPQRANVVRQEHKQNLDRRNSPDHLEDLVVHVAVPQQLEFHWYAAMLYKNRAGNEVGSQRSVFSWAFLNMSIVYAS